MYAISKTDVFMEWFDSLRDRTAKNKIRICIDRIEDGNL